MAPDDSAEFRRAEPADAPAIVAALVRSEGRTHFDPRLYDPAALAAALQRRRLRSWIAVDRASGAVLSHVALAFGGSADLVADAPRSRLVEFGHAFTRPESRGLGLASRLGALTIGWAIANDVGEIYSWATTLRPYGQLGVLAQGAQEMALLLAMTPPGVDRGFHRDVDAPEAALLYVLRLDPTLADGTWWIPPRHLSMVGQLMAGTQVRLRALPGGTGGGQQEGEAGRRKGSPASDPSDRTSVQTSYVKPLGFAVVEFTAAEPGCVAEALAEARRCSDDGANVSYFDIDPTRPELAALIRPLEAAGCTFAGVHPHYQSGRLRLRLQLVSGDLQPRRSIITASARGTALLDHLRRELPEWD